MGLGGGTVKFGGITYVRTLQDYRDDIDRYIRDNDPRLVELLNLTLRQICRECGPDHAKQAIKDFELKKRFGIAWTKTIFINLPK